VTRASRGSINRSATHAAGCVVAGGFAGRGKCGKSSAACCLATVSWLNFAIWFAPDSVEWAEDDSTFCVLKETSNDLQFVGWAAGLLDPRRLSAA
jgi:hypothetical protein